MKNVFYKTEKAGGGASPQAAAPRRLLLKRLFALLFALSLGMQWAYAYDFSNSHFGKTFYFNIIDQTNHYVEVTYPNTSISPWYGFEKPERQLSIPSETGHGGITYTVTTIGEYAFYDCSGVYSLVIPNTVTTIGKNAFNFCNGLTSVTIPSTVTTIGTGAFSDCSSLQFVTIQNGVTTIGASAFERTSISTVTIPSSVTSLGNYAFSNCSNLTSVWINSNAVASKDYTSVPNLRDNFGNQVKYYILSTDVTAIGKKAFFGASLESVIIPNTVTTIGARAFASCWSLTSVTIPSSVTTIHESAFYDCRELNRLTLNVGLTTIGDDAFASCWRLTSVTIPSTVDFMGAVFRNCYSLTSVTINSNAVASKTYTSSLNFKSIFGAQVTNYTFGANVTAIGNYALYQCSNMTQLTFNGNSLTTFNGNSLTTIGYSAFSGCSGLTSVTLPNSVTTIGSYAFSGCTGITEMTVDATTPPTVDHATFAGVPKNIPVYVPYQSLSLYKNADYWKDFWYFNLVLLNMPCNEPFNGNTKPEAWNTYIGQLQWDGNVGTAELTASSLSWMFGEPASPFDSHALAELKSENSYKWLVSPSIIIDDIDDAYLRVSLALTRPWGAAVAPGMQDNQSLGIYVTDDNGATWHKLLTFANNGGDLPLEAITAQGVQHALNLADFRGKTVKFGFYAATAEGDNHNVIHLDNFAVEQRNHSQAPTSVAVSEVAGRSAKVSWQAANALQSEWDVWVTNHTGISFPYPDDYLEQSGILTHLNTLNKEYVVEGLTPNTMYKAWVRYNDGHVTSPWTCSQYFETVPMCNEPTNIVVETTPTTVFVSWEPGQANQTRWTVGLGGSDLWEYTTTETSILIDVETMIMPGENFTVNITGYCEDGDGDIDVQVPATMQNWPELVLNETDNADYDIVIDGHQTEDGASMSQFIMPAEMLAEMQFSSIQDLKFFCKNVANGQPWGNNVFFAVYMKEVDFDNFDEYCGDALYPWDDMTLIYHGLLHLWDYEMTIPVGYSFSYQSGHLLIGIRQMGAGTQSQPQWRAVETNGATAMLNLNFNQPGCVEKLPQIAFSYRPDTYQPPTNLVAQYASPREVYYTWTPRPGQDKVRIQIADNPAFTSPQTKTATGDQYTALYSTALTPGATYYVRAKTLFIDPENGQTKESPWGPTVEMLVPDICDSPTNLAATEVGPFSAKLEWTMDNVLCEVEYRDLADETSQIMWTIGFDTQDEYVHAGWTAFSTDSDNWTQQSSGTGSNAISVMVSSITGTVGEHRHFFVTRRVELPGRISFDASGMLGEELSVYVSTSGTLNNFIKVYTLNFRKEVLPNNPRSIEVDLSAFEGYGYIAFVHEKDVFQMQPGNPLPKTVTIDNVRYLKSDLAWQSYGATSQGWAVVDDLTPGHTYKARVRATCEGSYYGYSDWCYSAEFTANPYIDFDDPDVEAVCAAAWGSNGKLTYAQAAAVESLGEAFRGNTDVNTFYELRYFTGLSDISDYAFYGCTNLEAISMPDQITSIGEYAFGYCESLTYVNFRNPIESIEVCAFRGSGLYHIYFPLHLTYLGNLAFGECNNLETVYLPASVISMDGNPFAYCKNLENIFVHDANPVFDSRDNCNAIVHTETNKLVSGCQSTVIPETVTTIGHLAFGGADFTDFTIPETVGHIDHSAFAFCNNLATLTLLSTNPPTMGMSVFDGVDNFRILVPCAAVETYQGAEGWSDFASIISGFDCPAVLHIEAYTNDTDGWYLITSPLLYDVSPEDVVNMTSPDFDLYAFDGNFEQAEWRNYKNNENNDFYMLRSGMGYLYANSSNVDLEFHGQTIEGDIFGIGLTRNDETKFGNWNLVGNPFTTEATASVTDYYRINPGTRRLTISNGPVNPMEGIFVEANDNLTNIDFTKLTRGSRGERAIESPMVNIDLRNAEGRLLDRARLRMGEGNNLGKLDMLSDPNRLYFRIDGKDYAVARVNGQGEMPLHFDAAQNGTYSLNVNVEGMEMAYLHLIDNMTGEDVDLLAQNGGDAMPCVSTYTFTGKPSDYASRFRLVFETGSSAEGDSFAFIDAAGNIVINGEGTLQIVDVMGRVVVSVGGHTRCVPTTGIPAGVYVLRLIDGNDVMTQKIVVE